MTTSSGMRGSPPTRELIYAREVDSESRAAAGLLATLTRVAHLLADLHHPFARSAAFSYYVPPAGTRMGTVFTLPDGREVQIALTVTSDARGFAVDGAITAEDEVLLALPRKRTPDIDEGLAVLDDYADQLARPAVRILDGLLDDIV